MKTATTSQTASTERNFKKFKLPKGEGFYWKDRIIWIKVYHNGREVRRSSGGDDLAKARDEKKKLTAKLQRGEISGGNADQVRVNELLDDYLDHLKNQKRESTFKIYTMTVNANLRPFFGDLKATKVKTEDFKRYRTRRMTVDGVADATVNRELTALRAAFYDGSEHTPPKVNSVPNFKPAMVQERYSRQGFLDDKGYKGMKEQLPAYLRPLFVVAYFTGVRKGELLKVRWHQVDFERCEIVLRRGETKADDGRVLPIFDGEMMQALKDAKRFRDESFPGSPWVFIGDAGDPIKDFRGAWNSACIRAGLFEIPSSGPSAGRKMSTLLFHDLRRTANRNMRRAGIDQSLRMKITGHKTPAMETRYNIIDSQDIHFVRATINANSAQKNTSEPPSTGETDAMELNTERAKLLQKLAKLPDGKLKALLEIVGIVGDQPIP